MKALNAQDSGHEPAVQRPWKIPIVPTLVHTQLIQEHGITNTLCVSVCVCEMFAGFVSRQSVGWCL